ncbi:MAG: hypothetical protein LBG94_05080 [Treponema sp.]|jgi:hypothetical protein|nr:hypothetical protein [Treponema sp.]
MNRFLIFFFLILIIPCAYSVPLVNVVSAVQAAQLRASSEIITETQLRNPAPRLMPDNSELRQFINTVQNTLSPGIMVEALFLYEKPGQFHTSANFWDNGQKTGVFNQITAISSLSGIQYFSASRDTIRTFYESSVVIDGPNSRNALPDPVFYQIPAAFSLFARQKDLTFGDNVYRYDYVSSTDIIYFSQENVTSLTYGIIPAIGRGNLRSVVAIIDCGDSLLIYALSMARAATLPGMGDRISASFSNRAGAVLGWLVNRLDNQIFPF